MGCRFRRRLGRWGTDRGARRIVIVLLAGRIGTDLLAHFGGLVALPRELAVVLAHLLRRVSKRSRRARERLVVALVGLGWRRRGGRGRLLAPRLALGLVGDSTEGLHALRDIPLALALPARRAGVCLERLVAIKCLVQIDALRTNRRRERRVDRAPAAVGRWSANARLAVSNAVTRVLSEEGDHKGEEHRRAPNQATSLWISAEKSFGIADGCFVGTFLHPPSSKDVFRKCVSSSPSTLTSTANSQ